MELVTDPTVISIDPGGVTGWSVFEVHPEALTDLEVPILSNITHRDNGQVRAIPPNAEKLRNIPARELAETERLCVKMVMKIVEQYPGAVVVIEDFILRRMSKNRELLSPVRLTSALEWAIDSSPGEHVILRQTPAEAMQCATDERLKAWGLYKRAGGMQHARDADRHCITFLRKAKASGHLRGQAWPHLYKQDGSLRPQLVS